RAHAADLIHSSLSLSLSLSHFYRALLISADNALPLPAFLPFTTTAPPMSRNNYNPPPTSPPASSLHHAAAKADTTTGPASRLHHRGTAAAAAARSHTTSTSKTAGDDFFSQFAPSGTTATTTATTVTPTSPIASTSPTLSNPESFGAVTGRSASFFTEATFAPQQRPSPPSRTASAALPAKPNPYVSARSARSTARARETHLDAAASLFAAPASSAPRAAPSAAASATNFFDAFGLSSSSSPSSAKSLTSPRTDSASNPPGKLLDAYGFGSLPTPAKLVDVSSHTSSPPEGQDRLGREASLPTRAPPLSKVSTLGSPPLPPSTVSAVPSVTHPYASSRNGSAARSSGTDGLLKESDSKLDDEVNRNAAHSAPLPTNGSTTNAYYAIPATVYNPPVPDLTGHLSEHVKPVVPEESTLAVLPSVPPSVPHPTQPAPTLPPSGDQNALSPIIQDSTDDLIPFGGSASEFGGTRDGWDALFGGPDIPPNEAIAALSPAPELLKADVSAGYSPGQTAHTHAHDTEPDADQGWDDFDVIDSSANAQHVVAAEAATVVQEAQPLVTGQPESDHPVGGLQFAHEMPPSSFQPSSASRVSDLKETKFDGHTDDFFNSFSVETKAGGDFFGQFAEPSYDYQAQSTGNNSSEQPWLPPNPDLHDPVGQNASSLDNGPNDRLGTIDSVVPSNSHDTEPSIPPLQHSDYYNQYAQMPEGRSSWSSTYIEDEPAQAVADPATIASPVLPMGPTTENHMFADPSAMDVASSMAGAAKAIEPPVAAGIAPLQSNTEPAAYGYWHDNQIAQNGGEYQSWDGQAAYDSHQVGTANAHEGQEYSANAFYDQQNYENQQGYDELALQQAAYDYTGYAATQIGQSSAAPGQYDYSAKGQANHVDPGNVQQLQSAPQNTAPSDRNLTSTVSGSMTSPVYSYSLPPSQGFVASQHYPPPPAVATPPSSLIDDRIGCHNCGRMNESDSLFCSGCGTRLVRPQAPAASSRKAPVPVSNASYTTPPPPTHDLQIRGSPAAAALPQEPIGFVDPLGRHKAHAAVGWGLGGKLVVAHPQSGAVNHAAAGPVVVHAVQSVLDRDMLSRVARFPGPLVGGAQLQKAEVVQLANEGVAEAAAEVETAKSRFVAAMAGGYVGSDEIVANAEDALILWQMVKTLVEQDGVLLRENRSEDKERIGEILCAQSGSQRPSSLDHVESSLIRGDRQGSVELALSQGFYSLALSLAEKSQFANVVGRYAREMLGREASRHHEAGGVYSPVLQVITNLFSGRGPASVAEWLPTPSYDTQIRTEDLSSWRQVVAAVLTSGSEGAAETLMALGDQLLLYSRVAAAHFCFLLASTSPPLDGVDSLNKRIVLLGVDHHANPSSFWKNAGALQLTEIYEYSQTLRGEASAVLPHLQAYKLAKGRWLSDLGLVDASARYGDAVRHILQSASGSAYYHETFFGALRLLLEEHSNLLDVKGYSQESWESKMSQLDEVWRRLTSGPQPEESVPRGDVPTKVPAAVKIEEKALDAEGAGAGAAATVGNQSDPAPEAYGEYYGGGFGIETNQHVQDQQYQNEGAFYGQYDESQYDEGAQQNWSTENQPVGYDQQAWGGQNSYGANDQYQQAGQLYQYDNGSQMYASDQQGYGDYPQQSSGSYDVYNQGDEHDPALDYEGGVAQPPHQEDYDLQSSQPENQHESFGSDGLYQPQLQSSNNVAPPPTSAPAPPTLPQPSTAFDSKPPLAPPPSAQAESAQDDFEDELGLSNSSLRKNKKKEDGPSAAPQPGPPKAESSKSADDVSASAPKAETGASSSSSTSSSARSSGIFSFIPSFGWGSKKEDKAAVKVADLGEGNQLTFDPVQKRWVSKKTGAPVSATKDVPPPPMASSWSAPASRNVTPAPPVGTKPPLSSEDPTPARAASALPQLSGDADRLGSTSSINSAGGGGRRRGARNKYVDIMNPGSTASPSPSVSALSFLPPAGVQFADGSSSGAARPKAFIPSPASSSTSVMDERFGISADTNTASDLPESVPEPVPLQQPRFHQPQQQQQQQRPPLQPQMEPQAAAGKQWRTPMPPAPGSARPPPARVDSRAGGFAPSPLGGGKGPVPPPVGAAGKRPSAGAAVGGGGSAPLDI
ncbi:Sec23-binding domain of Sec16-domain-containing protein, partial [Zopfochytrium polystomum]